MITLNINNFKCFNEVKIPLNQLTILAGGNGNGKSSVIQSLLLLRRTVENCFTFSNFSYNVTRVNITNVELNDIYCLGLGYSANLLHSGSKIELGISSDKEQLNIEYDTNLRSELYITPEVQQKDYIKENPLLFKEFYYLNAERVGPRISQSLKPYYFPNVGNQGELTAQVIKDLDINFKIEKDRILQDESYNKGVRFFQRINSWLSYILDGVNITAYQDDKTHTARIEVENSYSKGKANMPTNTGFGISYSLPIIVTCLLAKKDRFVIIENPEAHLHPSAQSKIGYFLGKMANAGLRVIVETHSDHIINGIQIAIAKKEIDYQKVTINYFGKDEIKDEPKVSSISLNEKGELSEWPKGFFDQSQIDFSELIKLRKNV